MGEIVCPHCGERLRVMGKPTIVWESDTRYTMVLDCAECAKQVCVIVSM
jgi:DNA-directed RNA polymerase subunit RPC12/RpoP